ncbi:MAG: hypothetical protein HC809_08650 [Gammaproteobacteria bacterium]|nr:hypothetical protein [Gammaproteobacteria bacterium]
MREPFQVRPVVLAVAVYVGIAVTGLAIANFSQAVRNLHIELELTQRAQDGLLAEYSRLLIERSMLSSYQNVDQVAERQLDMSFPEVVERAP